MKQKFIKVTLDNISVYQFNFIVLLKGEHTEKVLPICIGPAEAHSIAAALHNKPFRRPLSHDLIKAMLGELGCTVHRVLITDLIDGTFFAKIFIEKSNGTLLELDSRPSDALAVGMRYGAQLLVREDIFESNAVDLNDDDEAVFNSESDEAKADPVTKAQCQLDDAVREERYEDAARLRDKIQELLRGQ